MTSSASLLESMVPDEIILAVASYLNAEELLQLEQVSTKFHAFNQTLDDEVWKDVCYRRWRYWPRYRWENLKLSHNHLINKTWKRRYLWVEADYSRKHITVEELETSQWHFNFTPQAGGRGWETLMRCSFQGGVMLLSGWPPLLYRLVEHGNRQSMLINDFPPHAIERRTDGEWIIKNENVICVSSHKTDTLRFQG